MAALRRLSAARPQPPPLRQQQPGQPAELLPPPPPPPPPAPPPPQRREVAAMAAAPLEAFGSCGSGADTAATSCSSSRKCGSSTASSAAERLYRLWEVVRGAAAAWPGESPQCVLRRQAAAELAAAGPCAAAGGEEHAIHLAQVAEAQAQALAGVQAQAQAQALAGAQVQAEMAGPPVVAATGLRGRQRAAPPLTQWTARQQFGGGLRPALGSGLARRRHQPLCRAGRGNCQMCADVATAGGLPVAAAVAAVGLAVQVHGAQPVLVSVYAESVLVTLPSNEDGAPLSWQWPAAVYLVDPLAAAAAYGGGASGDTAAADLLGRLQPLLEAPGKAKYMYGGARSLACLEEAVAAGTGNMFAVVRTQPTRNLHLVLRSLESMLELPHQPPSAPAAPNVPYNGAGAYLPVTPHGGGGVALPGFGACTATWRGCVTRWRARGCGLTVRSC
ncbi:hypothetical protein HYH02_011744 [Chlamydomonas schloesseri]|uniref:Uncharacterized protein n=1 Tax=Chlamydomonas schloesseri TaxID=2026947 RepID=A0A835W0G0_9CHLO|nr:hypothetical protein HYH02_011744 [Chlamydomonas schloesseri]|eukprot:KAG2436032.1 hypothetical protein HYH02_011744 [Chlamydomonas schloesseri]